MKKQILLLLLCCSIFQNKVAGEFPSVTKAKRRVRVLCAVFEPPAMVLCAESAVSLVSHAVRGGFSEGLKDPVAAKVALSAALFFSIRGLRTTGWLDHMNEQREQTTKAHEFLGKSLGWSSVGYYVYRNSSEGIFTLSGAKMLCQPALDGFNCLIH
jgi:hypothetical protein